MSSPKTDAQTVRVDRFLVMPAWVQAISAAAKANWMSRLMTFRLLRWRRIFCIEIDDFGAEGHEVGGGADGQFAHAAAAFDQRGPKGLLADAYGAYDPCAGNYDFLAARHSFTNRELRPFGAI